MFMFKKRKNNVLYSPLDGETMCLDKVPDPAFSGGIMGNGIALKPCSDVLCSPLDGKVLALFPTKHAIGLVSNDGVEVLIHIGIDTVCMNGNGFKSFVEVGDKVKIGQKLIQFDKELIEKEGYSSLTMLLLTQKDKYDFNLLSEDAKKGKPLLEIYEKEVCN